MCVCVCVCVWRWGGGALGRNFGSFERSDALNDLRLKGDEKIGIFELVLRAAHNTDFPVHAKHS